jgi:hypothetical protein
MVVMNQLLSGSVAHLVERIDEYSQKEAAIAAIAVVRQ